MGFGGSGQRLKSDINVTPLVDVMLVLLIIFILVTPLLHAEYAIDLPLARYLDPGSNTPEITVVVHADGGVHLEGNPLDTSQLKITLTRMMETGDVDEVEVKADRRTPFGSVRRVLRAVRNAGFSRVDLVAGDGTSGEVP